MAARRVGLLKSVTCIVLVLLCVVIQGMDAAAAPPYPSNKWHGGKGKATSNLAYARLRQDNVKSTTVLQRQDVQVTETTTSSETGFLSILKQMVCVNGQVDWTRACLLIVLLVVITICVASRAFRGKPAGVINMELSGIHIDFRALLWSPWLIIQYCIKSLFGESINSDAPKDAQQLSTDDEMCNSAPQTLKVWRCDKDNVCELADRIVRPKCADLSNKTRMEANAKLVTDAQCMFEIKGFGAPLPAADSTSDAIAKELEPLFAMIPGFVRIPKQLNLKQGCADIQLKIGEPMSYDQLAAVVKPLDLFSLRSNTPFSNLIHVVQEQARSCTITTHVGMFVDTTLFSYPGMVDGEIYVVESVVGGNILPNNMDSVKDVLNQSVNGIQIRSLRKLMLAPEAATCIFMWSPLSAAKRKHVDQFIGLKRSAKKSPCRFTSVIAKYMGKPYPSNPFNFFPGIDNGHVSGFLGTELTSDYFCSEFVVSLYSDVGLLPANYAKKARSYYPADFFMSPDLASLFDRAHVVDHPHLDNWKLDLP